MHWQDEGTGEEGACDQIHSVVITGGSKAVCAWAAIMFARAFYIFTSKLIVKTCSGSSLEYQSAWWGASCRHSLAECASLLAEPLGVLGQMASCVIQGVGSGCIWDRHLQHCLLLHWWTNEGFGFGVTVQGPKAHPVCAPQRKLQSEQKLHGWKTGIR